MIIRKRSFPDIERLFAFIVLHYCAIEETLKCIDSIKRCCGENILIVIVDNASPNETGNVLYHKFLNDKSCKVILNKRNMGFAVGNNIGYRFAKAQGAEFICMMNSDTCVLDINFKEQVKKDYEDYKYFVLGPDIILKRPDIQVNPMGEHVLTLEEVEKKVVSLKVQITLVRMHLDSLLDKLQQRHRRNRERKTYKRDAYHLDVKLHGCCWIFSPQFIARYDGLNESTYLYLEEDMLYLEMRKQKHLMLYSPKVRIFHAEDASSSYIKQGREKRLFVLRNHLQSMLAIQNRLKELAGV